MDAMAAAASKMKNEATSASTPPKKKSPRVAEAPAHLECKYLKTVELPGETPNDVYCVVFGQVVGINIKDEYITKDGTLDVGKMRPIARLGYQDYAVVNSDTILTMQRPE